MTSLNHYQNGKKLGMARCLLIYLGWKAVHGAMEQSMECADSFLSKQQKKLQATKKSLLLKQKTEKVPELSPLRSANRLKVRENAMLTDVFARYGAKFASVSEGENASARM